MRSDITVRNVDDDALDCLHEIKEHDRRVLGAIIGDAIRYYYDEVFVRSDLDQAD